jgi:hypothetical protein
MSERVIHQGNRMLKYNTYIYMCVYENTTLGRVRRDLDEKRTVNISYIYIYIGVQSVYEFLV